MENPAELRSSISLSIVRVEIQNFSASFSSVHLSRLSSIRRMAMSLWSFLVDASNLLDFGFIVSHLFQYPSCRLNRFFCLPYRPAYHYIIRTCGNRLFWRHSAVLVIWLGVGHADARCYDNKIFSKPSSNILSL